MFYMKRIQVTLINIYYLYVSSVNCNISHYLNEKIEDVTNTLFFGLGLKDYFHQYENVQHMLRTHYKLRNISETIMDIYNTMKESHDSSQNQIDSLFNIEQICTELSNNVSFMPTKLTVGNIQRVVDENFENIMSLEFNSTSDFININKYGKATSLETTESKNNQDSSESMLFIEEFLMKIDNLTIDDFVNKQSDLLLKKTRRFERNKYSDLKIWRGSSTRRIYNGRATSVIEYPFIVSIHVEEEFSCAGSIISKSFILTSASCLQLVYTNRLTPDNLPNVTVRIGSDIISDHGELIPIVTIFFHPKYNPLYQKNNIAILKMESHTYFRRNRNIKRIEFDTKIKNNLQNSEQVTLLGWGAKYTNQKDFDNEPLSYADLNIFNHEMCKKIYSSNYVTVTNFCAGFIFKGAGACNKDLGGPAIVNGVLVGVVSFGPAMCGAPNSPTVFTKLSCYSRWIQSIINDDVMNSSNIIATTTTIDENQLNNTHNTNIKKNPQENRLNLDNITPEVSKHIVLHELKNSKQESKKNLASHPHKNNPKLQNNKHKYLLVLKSKDAKVNNRSYFESSTELPVNYNYYSIESDYTSEEGLSIEMEEDHLKTDVPRGIEQKLLTPRDRNTDAKREKIIEEHYINILENILKLSTKKRYKDILREAKVTRTIKTDVTKFYGHSKSDVDMSTDWRKTEKLIRSTKKNKTLNIYNKIVDFFKKRS